MVRVLTKNCGKPKAKNIYILKMNSNILSVMERQVSVRKELFQAESEFNQKVFGKISNKALCYRILNLRSELGYLNKELFELCKCVKQQ